MALQERARKLTYQDYVRFPDDGQRHEIIDGEHHVTASPFLRHQALVVRLTEILGPPIRSRGLGKLYIAPADVLLSTYDILQPDLFFVSTERLEILTEKNVQGAPDLVIEILSQSTQRKDKVLKLDRYGRFGVREYWLVDPWRHTVVLYRQTVSGFQRVALLSAAAGETLSTPLLPGLAIALRDLFAE